MQPDHPLGVVLPKAAVNVGCYVAPVSAEAPVTESLHEPYPEVGDAQEDARLLRTIREPVPRQRGDNDIKGVVLIAAVARRVGQER